jgi:hypothetical protein
MQLASVQCIEGGNWKRTGNFCSLLIAHTVGPVKSVVQLDKELLYLLGRYAFDQ